MKLNMIQIQKINESPKMPIISMDADSIEMIIKEMPSFELWKLLEAAKILNARLKISIINTEFFRRGTTPKQVYDYYTRDEYLFNQKSPMVTDPNGINIVCLN